MEKAKPIGEIRDVYDSRIVGVRKQRMKEVANEFDYEWAYRSPGTRALIIKENKVLITKEFRPSQQEFDYRLPGGKVFDSLNEYKTALQKGKKFIEEQAQDATKNECLEEVGIKTKNMNLIHISKCGATMRWELYYFLVDDFEEHEGGQQLESGELIHPEWKTFDEVKEMCLNKEIKEDRTVAVLLRFLLQK
jgi:ADP-ribose pyrophosphatase